VLSWLKDWFGRFGGAVDATVLRMVHWALHALASVVYTVFNHVGRAWNDVWAAGNWMRRAAWEVMRTIYTHIRAIIIHDIPHLFHWALAALHKLKHWALAWIDRLLKDLARLKTLAWHWIITLYHWAWAHIYVPLFNYARWLEKWLRKWGYTAWWYVTHPASLAALLFWPLVKLLEDNAWAAARVLGTFTLALATRNARRLAQLAEDIIAAVL
jgi:hypothetical protein